MEKFTDVFDNLEVLELIPCDGDQKFIEDLLLRYEHFNLTALNTDNTFVDPKILIKFFMKKCKIKQLQNVYITDGLLPFTVKNAAEMEQLDIYPRFCRNNLSLAKLRHLKRLKIHCHRSD